MDHPLGAVGPVRIVLTPDDFDARRAFYRDVIGLEVVEEFDGDEGILFRLAADTYLELLRPATATVAGLRFALHVADADAAHATVAAAGAASGPVEVMPWGHRSFTLTDPGGVHLTLFEPVGDDEP
ncbi:MAG TPA: VOC family protein [Acidimicrobiales bacterium]|nr:VOC family protein [Acidimicrobiales bacterium]